VEFNTLRRDYFTTLNGLVNKLEVVLGLRFKQLKTDLEAEHERTTQRLQDLLSMETQNKHYLEKEKEKETEKEDDQRLIHCIQYKSVEEFNTNQYQQQ